ncbi:uncharacterized protein RHOBADRAFT_66714, partial [Rhodotorula graminis WP1]
MDPVRHHDARLLGAPRRPSSVPVFQRPALARMFSSRRRRQVGASEHQEAALARRDRQLGPVVPARHGLPRPPRQLRLRARHGPLPAQAHLPQGRGPRPRSRCGRRARAVRARWLAASRASSRGLALLSWPVTRSLCAV